MSETISRLNPREPESLAEATGVEPVVLIADSEQPEQDARKDDPQDFAFTEFTVKLSDTWPAFLQWLAQRLQNTMLVSIREDQSRANSFYHSGRPGQMHYPIEVISDKNGVSITQRGRCPDHS